MREWGEERKGWGGWGERGESGGVGGNSPWKCKSMRVSCGFFAMYRMTASSSTCRMSSTIARRTMVLPVPAGPAGAHRRRAVGAGARGAEAAPAACVEKAEEEPRKDEQL